MFRIVYQSYGNESIYIQTLFSIFSLQHYINDMLDKHIFNIIVYTDNPDYFSRYKIKTSLLTSDQIQKWKGKYNFIHRIKIKIIEDVARKYNDAVIYIDSDTYFVKSPLMLFKSISPQISLMLNNEGKISKNNFKRLYKYLLNTKIINVKNTTLYMWNAGLIGIDKSNLFIIKEVLDLNDQIYESFYRHIVEQFSFSYILQKNTIICPGSDYLVHYCGDKELVVEVIKSFFQSQKSLPIACIYKNASELEPLKKIEKKKKTLLFRFFDIFIRLKKSLHKRFERFKIKYL